MFVHNFVCEIFDDLGWGLKKTLPISCYPLSSKLIIIKNCDDFVFNFLFIKINSACAVLDGLFYSIQIATPIISLIKSSSFGCRTFCIPAAPFSLAI